jgi:septal ring factor EnvC (AmiA/AmiB activator)
VVAVPSLMAALQARVDRAQTRAGELRTQIGELSGQLSVVEAELSRLQITRETVDEVLADGPGATDPDRFVDAEAAVAPLAELVPVLLAAQASGDATVTSPEYRRILVAFAEASSPLRCKDV